MRKWIILTASLAIIVLLWAYTGNNTHTRMPSDKKRDLAELFRHYGSDKDVNGYTSLYYTLFDHKKNNPVNFLEIGIGTMIPNAHSSMVGYALSHYKPGGSLRAWRDFFINGTIYGVDVQPDTQFFDEPQIKTFLTDSTDIVKVKEFQEKIGNIKFDIIIDDGSHIAESQFKTLANLYPLLAEGGIYIIEDIFPGSEISANPRKIAEICNGDPFFYSGIKSNLCIIYKNHININTQTKGY